MTGLIVNPVITKLISDCRYLLSQLAVLRQKKRQIEILGSSWLQTSPQIRQPLGTVHIRKAFAPGNCLTQQACAQPSEGNFAKRNILSRRIFNLVKRGG